MPLLALLLVVCFTLAGSAQAQELRLVPRMDGTVVLLHELRIPTGGGVVVDRIGPDGTSTRLTPEPVVAAAHPDDLAERLGDQTNAVLAASDVPNLTQLWVRMRSDEALARLLTFRFPAVAAALGRQVVDAQPLWGQRVTYRATLVNRRGQPTAEPIEATATLQPARPAAPTNVRAEVLPEGTVGISWTYPIPQPILSDHVAFFHVMATVAGGAPERVSEDGFLRIDTREEQGGFFTAPMGASITLTVVAVDVTGQEGAPSAPVTVVVRDVDPPMPPQRLEARVLDDLQTVELTWPGSPEPDVTGYHVYRAADSESTPERLSRTLIPAFEPLFVDIPPGGGSWHYWVTATDESGNESSRSGVAVGFTNDREPPAGVDAVEARFDVTSNTVRVTWQASAPPSDFATYLVFRQLGREATLDRINPDTLRASPFTDRGLAAQGFDDGQVIRYGVAVMDNSRNISDTVVVSLVIPDVTPPAPPTGFTADAEEGFGMRMRWLPPADQDLGHFDLARNGLPMARLERNTLVYLDTTAQVGTTYTYTLAAVDTSGNRSAEVQLETMMRTNRTLPPVRSVLAIATAEGVMVGWQPSPSVEAVRYVVYRSDSALGVYAQIGDVPAGPEPRFSDPAGRLGQWYRVRAVDVAGSEGAEGSAVQARSAP